jgi:hypothetical protein
MSPTALKKGGPANVPTFPSSVVPLAKMIVTGLQGPLRSFRVTLQSSLCSRRGLGEGNADAFKARKAVITERKNIVAV